MIVVLHEIHYPSPRFFKEIRDEYKASKSSPELYKTTFVHFMLGGEAASDIGVDGGPLNLNRMGGLLNADWESRLKAADALKHPWLQKHAKGLVCDNKRGTIMMTPTKSEDSFVTISREDSFATISEDSFATINRTPLLFLNEMPPQRQSQVGGSCLRECGRGLFSFLK